MGDFGALRLGGFYQYQDMVAEYEYYTRTFGDLNNVKACGTEDFLYLENQDMRAELEVREISYEYHEMSGNHDWVFWNKNLEPAIQWLLEKKV